MGDTVCVLSHPVVSDFCDAMDCSPLGSSVPWILQASVLERVAMTSPRDLPTPGIEPRSLPLQADSLPPELPGKPKNTGVGSLSLLHGVFPTQESNQGLPHCRRILYCLSYQGSQEKKRKYSLATRSLWGANGEMLLLLSLLQLYIIVRGHTAEGG